MKPTLLTLGLALAAGTSTVLAGAYEDTLARSLRGYSSHHEVPVTAIRAIANQYDRTFSSVFADLKFVEEQGLHLSASAPAPAPRRTPEPAPVAMTQPGYEDALLPPSPKPGHCYTRLLVPAKYRSEYSQVLQAEGKQKVKIRPAQYRTVDKQLLVREGTTKYEVKDPVYTWVSEKVMVSPESTKLVEVPAKYKTVTEKVLDVAAHTVWKRGSGAFEKLNNSTGEIMCLVQVPATYKTISKKVLVAPATVKEVRIPAEYKVVKRKVLQTPGEVVPVEIPAQYKTVQVTEMVAPPTYETNSSPDSYQRVSHKVLVEPAHMEWREILCETNINGTVVSAMQRALEREGYAPGSIDGRIGANTRSALTKFQKDNGLAAGNITYETLSALGVRVSGTSVID